VSATTRRPRPGETHGEDYWFLSDDEFERRVRAGDFVEHASYSGRRYGTLRSELQTRGSAGRPVLLEIEVQGARQVREALPDATQIFISPPSPGDLRKRLERRASDSAEQIDRRLEVARTELAAQEEFSRVVVNEDVEAALEELVELAARVCDPED